MQYYFKSVIDVKMSTVCQERASANILVSMLASSALAHGFEPWSGQIEDYEIGISCFSAKHAMLAQNQNVTSIKQSPI
jgi:hypothetical protein